MYAPPNCTMMFLLLSFATPLIAQRPHLEEQVRSVFLNEHGTPDLKNTLRQLGDDKEIVSVVMRLASRYRHAKEESLEHKLVDAAVFALGELRASSANELLSSLLTDRKVHENVRARAARSLGQIDAQANKESLLRALDPKVSDYF